MNDEIKSNTDLSPNEKLEHKISLAKFYIERFDGRREYEWKVTLGFWGAILGGYNISERSAK